MAYSTDQFMFDRFIFRGVKEDICKLYEDAYEECFAEPEQVDEVIWEVELRSENTEELISKYPLTKATGFILDWKDKYVIVAFSESGSKELTKSSRAHHFDGRKDEDDRWYFECPITAKEIKFEEYYANVDQYDRFTYQFPFTNDWFHGTYADRLLSKVELDFVITDGVLHEYRGSDVVVVIPSNVTDIESNAFRNCFYNKIKEVILPDSIKQIRERTFSSFVSLEKIILPQNLSTIEQSAFSSCAKLTSIHIPDTVTEIGEGAFWMCSALQSVHLPHNLREINDSLFYFCGELEQVNIPVGVKRLGSGAFSDCGKLNHVDIPDTVQEIGARCFSGCTALADLKLPNSITSLGRNSLDDTPWYQNCKNAGKLMVGAILLDYHTSENQVVIPAGIRTVSEYAFTGNKALEHLKFQDGLTSIKMCAFKDCDNLAEVICPECLAEIGQSAFLNCKQLKYLYAPGVETDNTPLGGATFAHSELVIVMPRLNISTLKNATIKQALCRGFLLHPELDSGEAKNDNTLFAIKQKKKILPWAFAHDYEHIVEFYLKNAAPAKGKLEAEFILPAREAGANKCLALIDVLYK